MIRRLVKSKRTRKWAIFLVLMLVVVAVSGCKTLSFYTQAIKGQYQLFAHQQPIQKLLAQPDTSETLRLKLQLVERLRPFADKELKLPVDGHYRKYVDVHRRFVVWNVEAAPEFSMEPKSWWYPLVGSLEYRGYFSEEGAKKYGRSLKEKGDDVYIGGSTAYSTLGWFKDPVLNTFINEPEADLAETLFHELGHQQVFARGDTDFNEAFATTVGQEGARRWLRSQGDTNALGAYAAELHRNDQFVHLIMETRRKLEELYGDEHNEAGKVKASRKKRNNPPDQLREQKRQVFEDLQKEYAKLKQAWGGNTDHDAWFAREVNNAQLNSVAAYYDLVPGFERLLELNGGDLPKFYKEAQRLADMPKKDRHQWLRGMAEKRS